jgi:hypothetical protein
VHVVAPGPLYRPAGHGWGVAVPVDGHAVPAGHDVHAVAPGPLKVPATHETQAAKAVPPGLYVPAAHIIWPPGGIVMEVERGLGSRTKGTAPSAESQASQAPLWTSSQLGRRVHSTPCITMDVELLLQAWPPGHVHSLSHPGRLDAK